MQKLNGVDLSKFGLFGAGSSKMAVLAEILQDHIITPFSFWTKQMAILYYIISFPENHVIQYGTNAKMRDFG